MLQAGRMKRYMDSSASLFSMVFNEILKENGNFRINIAQRNLTIYIYIYFSPMGERRARETYGLWSRPYLLRFIISTPETKKKKKGVLNFGSFIISIHFFSSFFLARKIPGTPQKYQGRVKEILRFFYFADVFYDLRKKKKTRMLCQRFEQRYLHTFFIPTDSWIRVGTS